MLVWTIVVVVNFMNAVGGQDNLLKHGDFESENYQDAWFCMGGCVLDWELQPYRGTLVSAKWNGIAQTVDFQGGERYKITAYVKIANTANGEQYHTVGITTKCDVNGSPKYTNFGTTPLMQPGEWHQIGGIRLFENGISNCRMYIQTEASVDYYVDEAEVVHIVRDTAWKAKARQRIEDIRKADVNIRVDGPGSGSLLLDVELQQVRHEFPFGSVVRASEFVDDTYLAYRQVFYDNFDWSVLGNALKWKQMERQTKGDVNFEWPLTAMNALRSNGIKLRCHCAFWDFADRSPNWVQPLTGQDLIDATNYRIDYVVNATKGMCEHWDVNNEMFHGDFFEQQSGDPDITMGMFRRMNGVDGKPLLFLNDFNVISNSGSTVAMKSFAVKYKQAGVPIGGIGCQGHMHEFDIHLVKARLDLLAEAGIPIVITEFAINDPNEHSKAQRLTDMLTLFFSHPAVTGVVLWGYWDGLIWEEDAYLFTGDNVTPNAAGLAYQDLFHNMWRTHVHRKLIGNRVFGTRAFKGEYKLHVSYKGQHLRTQEFTLTNEGRNIVIMVDGMTDGVPILTGIHEK